MASKVEELRETLISFVLRYIRWGGIEAIMAPDPKVPVAYAVDSLISAARAEGAAEGAEQERHKWEAKTLEALLNPDVSIADKLEAAGDPLACSSPFAAPLAPDKEES